MELTKPLDDVIADLRAGGKLPKAITSVTGKGSCIQASVNVHELPGIPGGVKAAARLAGSAQAKVDDRGISGRTWTLELRATHPVLRFDLSSFVTGAVQKQLAKVPGFATAHAENGATVIEVDLDRAGTVLPRLLPELRGKDARIEEVSIGEQIHLIATVAQ